MIKRGVISFLAAAMLLLTGCGLGSSSSDSFQSSTPQITQADISEDSNVESASESTPQIMQADISDDSSAESVAESTADSSFENVSPPAVSELSSNSPESSVSVIQSSSSESIPAPSVSTSVSADKPDFPGSDYIAELDGGTIIFIPASGNGTKYHKNENCSNMKGNVIKMTVTEAEQRGYTPCRKSKCFGSYF